MIGEVGNVEKDRSNRGKMPPTAFGYRVAASRAVPQAWAVRGAWLLPGGQEWTGDLLEVRAWLAAECGSGSTLAVGLGQVRWPPWPLVSLSEGQSLMLRCTSQLIKDFHYLT